MDPLSNDDETVRKGHHSFADRESPTKSAKGLIPWKKSAANKFYCARFIRLNIQQ